MKTRYIVLAAVLAAACFFGFRFVDTLDMETMIALLKWLVCAFLACSVIAAFAFYMARNNYDA